MLAGEVLQLGERGVDLGQEAGDLAFEFADQCLVAMNAPDKEAQAQRQPGVVGDKVTPLAARHRHLPLHLGEVPAWDGLTQQGVDMGRGDQAFALDQTRLARPSGLAPDMAMLG